MRWFVLLISVFWSMQQVQAQCSHHSLAWPQVTELKIGAQKVDGFVRAGDLDGARKNLPGLRATIKTLVESPMPAALTDPLSIKLELDDLSDMGQRLSGEDVDLATLKKVLPILLSTTDAVIENAGVFVQRRQGPHAGLLQPFTGPDGEGGYIELKLEDTGDLEVWLAKDEGMTQPFELDDTQSIQLTFLDHARKVVSLLPRDTGNDDNGHDHHDHSHHRHDHSHDHHHHGEPNVQNETISTFVFPRGIGDDAAWLKGGDFNALVVAEFVVGDKTYQSEAFILVPYSDHDHVH